MLSYIETIRQKPERLAMLRSLFFYAHNLPHSEYHPCVSGLIGVAQLARSLNIVAVDGGLEPTAWAPPNAFVLKNCQDIPRDWITRLFESVPRFTSIVHLENVQLSNDFVEILERHLPHASKIILRDVDFDEGSIFENEGCLVANAWTDVSLGTKDRPWAHDDIIRCLPDSITRLDIACTDWPPTFPSWKRFLDNRVLRYCWTPETCKKSASELAVEVMESAERYAGGGTLLLCAGDQSMVARLGEAVDAVRRSGKFAKVLLS
ncbi:hypothetical protein HDU90_006768 [Geranomyces variabilis]|nr:hypothetical protein HDU90_006768 [Geranomyces variabilis]